jgi:branched-chain amino acid transport system permease protein
MLIHLLGVIFDGLAYGMLLFVLSVGLSVTMGLMGFVNLAHTAFAMLGGYFCVTLMERLGVPFPAALPIVFVGIGLLSVVFERLLYRRLYRSGELDHVLLTIGLVLMSVATCAYFWGTQQQPVALPKYLSGYFSAGGVDIGVYRLFLVCVGGVLVLALIFGLERTRFGARVRAAVDNQRMARGLGIDVNSIFAATFAIGSGLAGLGGALAVNMVGLDPNFATKYLVFVLLVVSVGGLGSVGGTFAAAVVLGVSDVAGKYYVPEAGAFIIYAVMVTLLLWRPAGLFGRR